MIPSHLASIARFISQRNDANIIGWSPFDEVAMELTDRPDFNEFVWIEAFETVQIHLGCVGCGEYTKRWVEFEVV